jgi:Family of unknown function (DUF5317)
MIIPIVAVVLILLPAVLGGRLARLAGLRLQRTGWLTAALIAQFVVLQAFGSPGPVLRVALEAVHIGSYAVAAWFLWENRQVPWLWLTGLGAASNGITIALNDGTLPARAGALRTAGLQLAAGDFNNSAIVAHPRLWFLGDVFAIPASWPLANVFSVGDVLILTGVLLTSIWICGTALRRPWPPPARFQRPYPAVRSYPDAITRFPFPG